MYGIRRLVVLYGSRKAKICLNFSPVCVQHLTLKTNFWQYLHCTYVSGRVQKKQKVPGSDLIPNFEIEGNYSFCLVNTARHPKFSLPGLKKKKIRVPVVVTEPQLKIEACLVVLF
jgi:hypothetical protein